ncbi:alpha/beta hydrolase [Pseudonocardia sp. GCM10023141]|uniref:alpha/beta hydrolase n=1 Tax=Pseudonocardia sp. GCM10023141 TaxID=3252653 RepID=UPI00361376CB
MSFLRAIVATTLAGLLTIALAAAPAAAATPDSGLDKYLTQQLTWGPCTSLVPPGAGQDSLADPRFDCTFLTVPLDYAQPDGRTIKIAMSRQKALDPAARIGSLFTDPGGPGGSGVTFLPQLAGGLATSELAKRFDLIGFDPRGVGASEPAIDCSNTVEVDAERADLDLDVSPAGVAQTESEEKAFAQRCVDRVGTDVLAAVGTRDVARDLRVAYRAVGDQKLTYVGYSYGTEIGSTFASQFPTEVRALVLDGAIDPAQDPVQARLTQSRGFQRAFDGFAAVCVTRPDCGLGADKAGASARLQAILKPLITTPIPAGDGRTLGYNDAMTGVITALYSQALWGFMNEGLTQVGKGDGTNLLRLADAYYERAPDGSYGNLIEAFQAITCVDRAPITDPKLALDISRQQNALAPFADPGVGPSSALELCAFWPVEPTSAAGPVVAPGLPTVLVVSSTGDPATPYEDGVSLAKQMKARLLTVENDGHTVALQGLNKCADDIASRYLVDLTLPAADPRCARQPPA